MKMRYNMIRYDNLVTFLKIFTLNKFERNYADRL